MKKHFRALGIAILGFAMLIFPVSGEGAAKSVPIQVLDSYVLCSTDGKELVARDEYQLIMTISPKGTAPEDELFFAIPMAKDDAKQNAPRTGLLMDAEGKALTEAQYQYMIAENGRITYSRDGLYGVMDRELNEVVPCAYTNLVANGEGGYLALTSDPNAGKPTGVYYISSEGEEKPTGIRIYYELNAFSDGLMAVMSSDNGKYGYLNTLGEWVIQPQFRTSNDFYKGYAVASIDSGTGMIDKDGNWVMTPKYRNIATNLLGGDIILANNNSSKIQFIDPSTHQPIKEFEGEDMSYDITFDNGLAVILDAEKSRLIDEKGDVVMSGDSNTSYTTFSEMGDRVIVQTGLPGEMGAYLYDLSGTSFFGPAQEIWFLGTLEGKNVYAYAMYEVETDAEPTADWESVFEIEGSRQMGVIDQDGNTVLPPKKCTSISLCAPDAFLIETDAKKEMIDANGDVIISYSIAQ